MSTQGYIGSALLKSFKKNMARAQIQTLNCYVTKHIGPLQKHNSETPAGSDGHDS